MKEKEEDEKEEEKEKEEKEDHMDLQVSGTFYWIHQLSKPIEWCNTKNGC